MLIKQLIVSTISSLFLLSCCTVNYASKLSKSLEDRRESVVQLRMKHIAFLRDKKNENNKLAMFETTGSGTVIENKKDYSLILTAAHVCGIFMERQKKMVFPHYNKALHRVTIQSDISIFSIHGDEQLAIPLYANLKDDVCIVVSERVHVKPARLAKKGPDFRNEYFNMSFPHSIWDEEFIPVFRGHFAGIMTKFGRAAGYSIPTGPGASGSGIFNNRGEIIGIVHSYMHRFNHVLLASTYEQTKETILKAKEELKNNEGEIIKKIKELTSLSILTPPIPERKTNK